MPNPRLHAVDKGGVYHCYSTIHETRPDFSWDERIQIREWLTAVSELCAVEIINFALLPRSIDLLIRVAPRRAVKDDELLRRLRTGMEPSFRRDQMCSLIEAHPPRSQEGKRIRANLTSRMFNLSEFMKVFNQGISQQYMKSRNLKGSLWRRRFKSLPVEDTPEIVGAMSAATDARLRWEGITESPDTYHFCGFGEAAAGNAHQRQRLSTYTGCATWVAARKAYAAMVALENPPKRSWNMPRTKGKLAIKKMADNSLTQWRERYPNTAAKKKNRSLDKSIAALLKFKKKHGHFLVPRKNTEDSSLGRWVADLRSRRATGTLKDDIIEKLDAIGYDWTRPPRGRVRTKESSGYVSNRDKVNALWQESYDKLVEFYHEHGHTKVKRAYSDSKFANWVWIQRSLKRNGKLLPEREEKLNALHFIWELPAKGNRD